MPESCTTRGFSAFGRTAVPACTDTGDAATGPASTSWPTGCTPRALARKPQLSSAAASGQYLGFDRIIVTMRVWPPRVAAPTNVARARTVYPFLMPIAPS